MWYSVACACSDSAYRSSSFSLSLSLAFSQARTPSVADILAGDDLRDRRLVYTLVEGCQTLIGAVDVPFRCARLGGKNSSCCER